MSIDQDSSIHSKHIAEVHNVPISVLIRPFASILDNVKVESDENHTGGFCITLVVSFIVRTHAFSVRYTGYTVFTDRKPVVSDDGSCECYPYP